jgi:hypothetical protein
LCAPNTPAIPTATQIKELHFFSLLCLEKTTKKQYKFICKLLHHAVKNILETAWDDAKRRTTYCSMDSDAKETQLEQKLEAI